MKRQKVKTTNYKSKGKTRAIRLYGVWCSMRNRCLFGTKSARYYRDRGITICDEWDSFQSFRQWALSAGYRKGLTLDRIDNDGNYEPDNCRWATIAEQNRNKRTIKGVDHKGENNPSTSLTNDDVRAIRKLYASGVSKLTLAEEFERSQSTIYQIATHRSWTHI